VQSGRKGARGDADAGARGSGGGVRSISGRGWCRVAETVVVMGGGGAANLCRNHEICLRQASQATIRAGRGHSPSSSGQKRRGACRDILRRRARAGTTKASRHAVVGRGRPPGPPRRGPVVIGRRWTHVVRAAETKAPAVRLNGRFRCSSICNRSISGTCTPDRCCLLFRGLAGALQMQIDRALHACRSSDDRTFRVMDFNFG